VGFLAKWLFDRWAENHKERFRSELEQVAFTFQTRFGKLHEKRAEVIADLHNRILRTDEALHNLGELAERSDAQERYDDFLQQFDETHGFYKTHSIYFEPTTAEIVGAAFENLFAFGIDMKRITQLSPGADFSGFLVNVARSSEANRLALIALQDEFRRLLGVDISKPTHTKLRIRFHDAPDQKGAG
jgi:hypothetical protein